MKELTITAYPYAVVYGTLNIPDDIKDMNEYVLEHWEDIEFGKPDLDYAGTDFEICD